MNINMKRGLILGFIILVVAGGFGLYYSTNTKSMDTDDEMKPAGLEDKVAETDAMTDTDAMDESVTMDESAKMAESENMTETDRMVETEEMTSETMMTAENMDPKMFKLKDVDGNTVSLVDFKGKKVYLKFWASWCSICLAGIDEIDQFSGEMNDFEIITIVSPDFNGEQNETDFVNWYQGLELKNMKTVLDPKGNVAMAYGVRAYPTSVFIDTKGNVVKTIPGHLNKVTILQMISEIK